MNILSADAKVSFRVYKFGSGANIREYFGEVANDAFTITGGKYSPGTTRWIVTIPKAAPTPVVTSTPAPTPTPTLAVSSFYATAKSARDLAKLSLRATSASYPSKVGRSLKAIISSVGAKSTVIKVSLRTPESRTFTLVKSTKVGKNKSYSTPIIKFLKAGSFKMTVKIGNKNRALTIKVTK